MRVEHRAVDVVLALQAGVVADPHRPRALVAGEVLERLLAQVALAADAVHDLQRPVGVALEVGDVLDEVVGLPVQPQRGEPPQRQRGVAHPREAVIPVALAARGLRQRGRRSRDDRAGRSVGQALQHERRALQLAAPAVVGEAPGIEPVAPVLGRHARGSRAPPRRSAGRRAGATTTARRSAAHPSRGGDARGPCRPRCRRAGPSAAAGAGPRPRRPGPAGRPRPALHVPAVRP